MKAKHIYLLLVTLAVLFLFALFRYRQANVQELEWPPALSAAVEKAPTVPYCDLVRNPTRFNNEVVRTEAIFFKNLENTIFYDASCKDNSTWVEFDPAYGYADEVLKKKLAELACLRQHRCDGRARVTAVGRFEGPNENGYGHLGCCPYRFSIMRLEKVEPVPGSTSQP